MDGRRTRSEAGKRTGRRSFDREFKQEAVRMLLDGHSARSVAENLGLSGPGLLYRWKAQLLKADNSNAQVLEARVRELQAALQRAERERDILKKALAIFSRNG